MELDDELCLCFHVTKRKVLNYLRIEKPRRAGQLSDCFGAGTGCGWCRPYLRFLFEQQQAGSLTESLPSTPSAEPLPDRQEYAELRARYVQQGGGVPPPGATPIDRDLA